MGVIVPKSLQGQKRLADVIGAAVIAAKIARGEIEENSKDKRNPAAVILGKKGGKARANSLTSEQRKAIAKKAAKSRWKKD